MSWIDQILGMLHPLVAPIPESDRLKHYNSGPAVNVGPQYVAAAQKGPTPTPMQGEDPWVMMMLQKNPQGDAAHYHDLYRKAVSAPGGHPYIPPTHAPQQQVLAAETTPNPVPTNVPVMSRNAAEVLKRVQDVYRSHMPASSQNTPLEQYYPIASQLPAIVNRGESLRPGAGALAAIQAFYESTGGRGGGNYWGILPGGEGNPGSGGHIQAMPIEDQLAYLFGPHALGGGANPNMNILNEGDSSPLNNARIYKLYQSYNPSMDYLPGLLSDYSTVMGR